MKPRAIESDLRNFAVKAGERLRSIGEDIAISRQTRQKVADILLRIPLAIGIGGADLIGVLPGRSNAVFINAAQGTSSKVLAYDDRPDYSSLFPEFASGGEVLLGDGVKGKVTSKGELQLDPEDKAKLISGLSNGEAVEAINPDFEKVGIGDRAVVVVMVEGGAGKGFGEGDEVKLLKNVGEADDWLHNYAEKYGASLNLDPVTFNGGKKVLRVKLDGLDLPEGLPADWNVWSHPVLEKVAKELGVKPTYNIPNLNTRIAKKLGKDGAYILFVFPRGKFNGMWGAWSSQSGYIMMSFDAGGFIVDDPDPGRSQQSLLIGHEVAHEVLRAPDEYSCGVVDEDLRSCASENGVMNVRNGNQQVSGGRCLLDDRLSLMRADTFDLKSADLNPYAVGVAGWWSRDGDSVPDILGKLVWGVKTVRRGDRFEVNVEARILPWGPAKPEDPTVNINSITSIYKAGGVGLQDVSGGVSFTLPPRTAFEVCAESRFPTNGNGGESTSCIQGTTGDMYRVYVPIVKFDPTVRLNGN